MEDETETTAASSYRPTPEGRAEGLRHAALHAALSITGNGASNARTVILEARQFESYLKGDDQ